MHEQNHDNRLWSVMIHLNPKWIQVMLDKEQHGEQSPTFQFYVPYLDLLSATGRDLRSDFHNFVFIHASEERLNGLLYADWNTNTRLRLYPYRNKEGRTIKIHESELNRLRVIFRQQNLEFFVGTSVRALEHAQGSKVRIRMPYWEDKEGVIRRVKVKNAQGTALLKVAFLIDGMEREITFPNLHESDIEFVDEHDRQLLSGKVVENFEREVAILLGHKFVHKRCHSDSDRKAYLAGRQREDMPRLRRLLSFSDIEMDNEDDHRRFIALMLMCSVMLGDAEASTRYQSQIETWFYGKDQRRGSAFFTSHLSLFTPTDAYMMIALFVATRDSQLRTAVKDYRDTHPDCPPIISRFINKVRDAKTRKY